MNARLFFVSLAAMSFVGSYGIGTVWAAEKLDPTGTWTWSRELEGQKNQSVLKLALKEGKLTGTYKRMGQEVPIANASFKDDKLSFTTEGKYNDQKVRGKFQGKLTKDEITGNIEISIDEGSIPLDWTAKRGVDIDDVAGNWKLKIATPDGNTLDANLKLTLDGDEFKGTYTSRFGEREPKEISLKGSDLTWTINSERDGRKFKGVYKGKIDGKTIKGALEYDFDGNTGSLDFTGERVVAAKDPAKTDAAKEKAKPDDKSKSDKSSSLSQPARHVIVMLKNRNETLVVYSGAKKGASFSILSKEGKTLANEISLAELKTKYPQIYEMYRISYAHLWAGSDSRAVPKSEIHRSSNRISGSRAIPYIHAGKD